MAITAAMKEHAGSCGVVVRQCGVRVPERVTWRIPHGRLIPRGPPYIIQISYANSLINNAGTERFIIPRYHRRLNTTDLHANSPKDGVPRSLASSTSGEGGGEHVRLAASGTESKTRPSVYLTPHYASERASERVSAGKRAIISCRRCRCTTKLPGSTPRNLAIF